MIGLFESPRAKGRRADTARQNALFPWLNSPQSETACGPRAIASSPTSRGAARQIAPHASTLRERLLQAFREAGVRGLTDEEGMRAAQIPPNNYRPRRLHLEEGGLIEATGLMRATASGDRARVYVLAGGNP
jgi:hypothetical protein